MEDLRTKAIKALIERRKAMKERYEGALSEPASYGITGSVNVVNQKLEELKRELANIDSQIMAMVRGERNGISLSIPDYGRHC